MSYNDLIADYIIKQGIELTSEFNYTISLDDLEKDFDKEYLDNIKYICLVMSKKYIQTHFDDIKKYANVIENRLNDEDCTMESVLKDNAQFLESAQKHNANYVLIDDEYKIEI